MASPGRKPGRFAREASSMKGRAMITICRSDRSPVARVLAASPHAELHRLEVHESEFTVEIVGEVHWYYLKQLAQSSIRDAVGDRRLINRIIVADRASPPKG
jgi:hypothetical protein